jgi:transposase
MSKGISYTEEFKKEVVTQVTDRGYSVKEVSGWMSVSTKSQYDGIKQYQKPVSMVGMGCCYQSTTNDRKKMKYQSV